MIYFQILVINSLRQSWLICYRVRDQAQIASSSSELIVQLSFIDSPLFLFCDIRQCCGLAELVWTEICCKMLIRAFNLESKTNVHSRGWV